MVYRERGIHETHSDKSAEHHSCIHENELKRTPRTSLELIASISRLFAVRIVRFSSILFDHLRSGDDRQFT